MKAPRQILGHLHHRAGWPVILLLMFQILAWVWLAAREPVYSVISGDVPRWVLSGSMFSEPFDIAHAGSALDQPTIGKWLFWFTVMTGSSLPYTAVVSWMSDRRRMSGNLAFNVCTGILGFFLLCILSWPLLWLVQYIASMGLTPRRAGGLCYGIQGGWLVIFFLIWALRTPDRNNASLNTSSCEPLHSPNQQQAYL